MSGTSVDSALLALVALWRSVTPTGVVVIDGPPYDPPENFLAVGWERQGAPAVSASMASITVRGPQSVQQIDVLSLLSFSVDAGGISTARQQLAAAFDVFADALIADQQLGGAVQRAQISDYDVTPILTEAGSVIDLRFTTHITAAK